MTLLKPRTGATRFSQRLEVTNEAARRLPIPETGPQEDMRNITLDIRLSGQEVAIRAFFGQLTENASVDKEKNAVAEMEKAFQHIDTFLAEIYCLVKQGDTVAATDMAYEWFDELLCKGFHTVCNQILRQADVSRLSSYLLRSFLSLTANARDKAILPDRPRFYEKAYKAIRDQQDQRRADRLLQHLK